MKAPVRVAALLSVALFSGCAQSSSRASSELVEGPEPNPTASAPTAGGPDRESSLSDEPCPDTSTADLERADQAAADGIVGAQEKLDAAAEEIASYAKRHPRSFTGQRVCPPTSTLFVHRVVGDRAFDAAATAATARHQVTIELLGAPYSQATLEVVRHKIMADYRDDLERAGAPWRSAGISRLGWVEIGVQKNFDEARAVLARFGDRVHVIQGSASTNP